jgi:citrate synthase
MTMELVAEKTQNKGGLDGIVASATTISRVDGTAGRLIYRGYDIHDLAQKASFEEVAHLLWLGHLPNKTELEAIKARLVAEREVPEAVWKVLRALPSNVEPIDALRTAASAWGAVVCMHSTPNLDQSIALTARFPLFLAAFHRLRQGLEPLASRSDLGHAANYLYLLTGREPEAHQVRALDAYLILLADHAMNASTFAARVVVSTQSDMSSAIVAAIGALKGPLHGGAPSKSLEMLDSIRAAGGLPAAEGWLRETLAKGERLMGFGHRIYKTDDPRAVELRRMSQLAAPEVFSFNRGVEETALALLEEFKPGRKIYTNVEYYSAVLLSTVGLPGDLFTPTFACGRVAGWTAHVLEQVQVNRLIRPDAAYIGPEACVYIPVEER